MPYAASPIAHGPYAGRNVLGRLLRGIVTLEGLGTVEGTPTVRHLAFLTLTGAGTLDSVHKVFLPPSEATLQAAGTVEATPLVRHFAEAALTGEGRLVISVGTAQPKGFFWDGAEWKELPAFGFRVWDGAAWQTAVAGWVWAGGQWVQFFAAKAILGETASFSDLLDPEVQAPLEQPFIELIDASEEITLNRDAVFEIFNDVDFLDDLDSEIAPPVVESFQETIDASEAISVTFGAIPTTPTNLNASTVSGSRIDLSWSDNSDNEDEFRLERESPIGGGFSLRATLGANATSFSDTGLSEDTTYNYRIQACNEIGCSTFSNEDAATTLEDVPDAPTGLTVTDETCDSISLSWTDNANNEDEYRVLRRVTGDDLFSEVASLGANTTSYTDTGLMSGGSWDYKVEACNSAGCTSSSTVTGTTEQEPADPANASAAQVGENQVSVSWTEQDTEWDQFRIERGERPDSGVFDFLSNDPNGSPFTDTDFGGDLSSVSNFAATGVDEDQIDLSWDNGTNRGDEIAIWRDGSLVATFSTSATSYSDTGLNPDTTHSYEIAYRENRDWQYRVRAENDCGVSGWDETTTISVTGTGTKASDTGTSLEAQPPDAPSNLIASDTSDEIDCEVGLSWQDNSDNEDDFEVWRSTDNVNFSLRATVDANSTAFIDGQVDCGVTYYYKVRACRDGVGCSAFSNTDSATPTLEGGTA